MNDGLREKIVGFYRSEVESILTPAPPRLADVSLSERKGTVSVRTPYRDAAGMVGIAAAAALCLLVPVGRADESVSRGMERLFANTELRASVSRALADTALMLGESIVKE